MEPSQSLAQIKPDVRAERWRLVRDLIVFQGKLVLDGLKDLVLGPVAIGAALMGLFSSKDDPGESFRSVLSAGRKFDRWVDLFGERQAALPPASDAPSSAAAASPAPAAAPAAGEPALDDLVGRVEKALVDQYQRGGVTAKAKDAIDKAIDALQQEKWR